MEHKQRVHNADTTHTLLTALKMLEKTDFTTMMGSGIMVNLTPITEGRSLAGEFMLAAEDMAGVAPLLAASIRNALTRRTALLRAELADIEKII